MDYCFIYNSGSSRKRILSFYVLTPIYETSTTLIVNKPAESISAIQYNDVLLSQKLAKTYGEIIKSRTVLSRVIENLSLNYTVGEFREKSAYFP